jgi:hypothetical protein
MSQPFHFHYEKASQAIASLLRSEPGHRMNYYRLLKLLYIADRESVRLFGRPIVGGRLVAMDRGPLHSAGFDLMTGKDPTITGWSQYFTTQRFEVEMIHDPGNDALSKREIDLLNNVRAEHESHDDWDVGLLTHEFTEFKKNRAPQGKSRTIPFEDLLVAVGRATDMPAILADARHKATFDRVFGA